MLTRLKVSGFKNLVGVDVPFGPFTCIAGVNGVGKSNLLDAISFLSALADRTLIEAALNVRDEEGRTGDVSGIFHRVGEAHDPTMSFEAEMIVPRKGVDDFGQSAEASITFLRYKLDLGYTKDDTRGAMGGIRLLHEELAHIKIGDAKKRLKFPHHYSWRQTAITGKRRTPWFISTEPDENGTKIIRIHQDGSSGNPRRLLASNTPKTAVSGANAESPTAMLARREMQSWRRLQLEPSALRKPDPFTASTQMGSDGSHLAAALYDLARGHRFPHNGSFSNQGSSRAIYTQLANRLSELIDDVRAVDVDRDEKRELLTLQVVGRDGTSYPARALSDGTLRFLALAVIELDPTSSGLLCLEEPENGIHPARIPAMLRLLQDIATDVNDGIGPDNPLRQVIINTHSPAVVAQVGEDTLLFAENLEQRRGPQRFKRLAFSCLPDTWRSDEMPPISKGKLLSYLSPVVDETADHIASNGLVGTGIRVIDRPELQMELRFPTEQ